MEEFSSCKTAIERCLSTKAFAIAHLYQEEKAMDMHIHDCYELYYSISGGKQFLIDNRFYAIAPGDLFIINQYVGTASGTRSPWTSPPRAASSITSAR